MRLFDLEPDAGAPAGSEVVSPAPTAGTPNETGTSERLRLVVAYDGSGFRGFAAQQGQRTVAGDLAAAIAKVVRHDVELTCAGRTDAGVHALGQVVHFDARPGADLARLVKSVNTMLAPAIVVRQAEVAPPAFDARRSARGRRYRYLVLEASTTDPLLAPASWHVPGPLDLRAMAAGADALIGEHDYRAFCRRAPGTTAESPIMRRVFDARWSESLPTPDGLGHGERLLRFDIWAQSFCHQMVRSVVGTLVEVGRGRRRASDVTEMLRAEERASGTTLAPPGGLCLVSVDYYDPGLDLSGS